MIYDSISVRRACFACIEKTALVKEWAKEILMGHSVIYI